MQRQYASRSFLVVRRLLHRHQQFRPPHPLFQLLQPRRNRLQPTSNRLHLNRDLVTCPALPTSQDQEWHLPRLPKHCRPIAIYFTPSYTWVRTPVKTSSVSFIKSTLRVSKIFGCELPPPAASPIMSTPLPPGSRLSYSRLGSGIFGQGPRTLLAPNEAG